ncbi:MAG: ABC transporter substrate-binding protein [Betaproteobacteria bacterium]|nr:ABC transporter substrate-binding protein [Betaproteobacteria bacterium]
MHTLVQGIRILFVLMLAVGPAAADTVKVGVIMSSSGPFARWGEQFRQAIEVFQKQNGKTVSGHTIEVIYRDDGGPNPVRAKQLAEELILREKVQFLGGFVFTPNALAVADLVTEAKMPTVIFNAATGLITRKSPYFVRTSHTIPQAARPIGEWAVKNDIKRVVTAVSDYAPGHDAEVYFSKAFKAGGGQVMESIRIPLATTDFSPFFERILQQKPDAVFVFGPGGPPTVGLINTWASRLKPAGIKFLGTAETQQIDLPKIGRSALGLVTSFHYTETVDNPLNKALWADLVQMFGKDTVPDLASVGAYDGMRVIYRAVEKFGPRVTGDQAIGLWRGMQFNSPRGPFRIDEKTRDVVENIYLRRVEERDGKLVNVNFQTFPMVKDPWKEDNPE